MENKCLKCNKFFTISDKSRYKKKYCSRKCANFRTHSFETKEKIKNSMNSKLKIKNQFGEFKIKPKFDIVGDYTKIYLCRCKYSGKTWYSTTPKHIHPEIYIHKKHYTHNCQFDFCISKFDLWFIDSSDLIRKYGWYSTPGSNKKGIRNIDGISRDHLYSISDGWKNNIDPKIIKHPANCSLIPHRENQRKHKKSKITIQELHLRIEKFEKLYPGYGGGTRTPVDN